MVNVLSQASGIFHGTPHEVYNLAAQSHVGTSFKQPLATWDMTAKGVLNILEAIRQGGYIPHTRFYQASTSEMYGDNYKIVEGRSLCDELAQPQVQLVQDETVAFAPRSPYAIAKTAAHQAVGLYRDAYELHGSCGILFNHESPRRGENFVTRKISRYVGRLAVAKECGDKNFGPLKLGNLAARRDWGHAKDYVAAMHLMLQQDMPGDYIVATGEDHSVKDFCQAAFSHVALNYEDYVEVDPSCMRPAEVPHLHGCADLAREKLGWRPTKTFDQLVRDMVEADYLLARQEREYESLRSSS
jgi:GDPmannose 4,6-dehydratase